MAKFTSELKHELYDKLGRRILRTDNDIMNFCDDNDIPYLEVCWYLANLNVPDTCKGCRNVCGYRNLQPCAQCKRAYPDDFYKESEYNHD